MTRPYAVLTLVCVGLWPSIAAAQTNAALPRCSPYVSNRDCAVTIDANSPTTPLPLKMKDGAKLTVVVEKRPLQTIELEEARKEVEAPDTTRAFVSAVSPGLAVLNDSVMIMGGRAGRGGGARRGGAAVLTLVSTTSSDPIATRLVAVAAEQASIRQALLDAKSPITEASDRTDAFDKTTKSDWTAETLKAESAILLGVLGAAASVPLPSGQLAGTEAAIKEIIDAYVTRTTPTSDDDVKEIARLLNVVTAEQAALGADLVKATAAVAALRRIAIAVGKLTYDKAFAHTEEVTQGREKEPRSSEAALSVTDAITGKSKDLVKVIGTWATSRWETSSGLLFSDVRVRTFSAAPRWENGNPVLFGATTDVNQFVHETAARPMVVPFAFIHYNVYETAVRGGRVAILGTAGIGVNPHSKFADFAYGGSLGYRNVFLSVLKHRTRDLRLSGGLVTGQSLGPKPPALATDRFWVTDWSVALTLRVF